MAEGRIAQVVSQTSSRHDGAYQREQRVAQLRMPAHELVGHIIAQRAPNTGHLERMGEAVVHKDAARQGEHLCLVLQTAEGSREDEPVVVAFEFATVVVSLGMAFLLSEPLIGNQLLPLHADKGTNK